MQETPDQQWRALTAHYAEMWDDELLNLASDYKDLTEMAQQVLRDEMKKRGLGDPTAPRLAAPSKPSINDQPFVERSAPAEPDATAFFTPVSAEERLRLERHYSQLDDEGLLDLGADFESLTFAAQEVLRDELKRRGLEEPVLEEESETETESPQAPNPILEAAEKRLQRLAVTDSFRVKVCDCQNKEHGYQLAEMLSRAGIQSSLRSDEFGTYFIEVSAEQADDAEAILQQPIPQDVIDNSKMEVPEFEMPRCPKCGSEEPILVATDPANQWQCESCGNEWTDPIPETKEA
jgi:hypothetical protein